MYAFNGTVLICWLLSGLVSLFYLKKGCRGENVHKSGESLLSFRGRWDTRGTGGKWQRKAHLIHQSVLAHMVWDGSRWWLLLPDRPCLFINELHHWYVALDTLLCLRASVGCDGHVLTVVLTCCHFHSGSALLLSWGKVLVWLLKTHLVPEKIINSA